MGIRREQRILKLNEVGHGLAQEVDPAPRGVAMRLQHHPPLGRDVAPVGGRLLHQVTPALGARAQQVVGRAERPSLRRGRRGDGGVGGGRALLHECLELGSGRIIHFEDFPDGPSGLYTGN